MAFFTILLVVSGTFYYLFLYRIYRLSLIVYSNKRWIIGLIYVILSAGFIYCTIVLFDHFSVASYAGSGKSVRNILDYNFYIPYSLIFLICSMVLIVSGFFLHMRLVRQIGIFFLIASILKVFIMDFHLLSETMRIGVFFILGCLLILASLGYKQFRKMTGKQESHKGSILPEEAELPVKEKED
jgi:uncharacterized membrane protein